jgi:hypothetical protein
MRNLTQAFARLSPRERTLVSLMVGLVLVLGLGFLHFSLSSSVSALETSIAEGQAGLRKLYANTTSFMAARKRFVDNREAARARKDLNLTTAIAGVAAQVTFRAADGSADKVLKEYLEYAASKVRQVNVGDKPARASAGRVATEGYFQNDQEVKLSEGVPLSALYAFLARVEALPEGLFVTELRVERDARDITLAGRGTRVVVSTYYHVPETAPDAGEK